MSASEQNHHLSSDESSPQSARMGCGNDVKTQLTFALSRLKSKIGEPQTFQAITEYLGMCESAMQPKMDLMKALKDHPRVHWQPELLPAEQSWGSGTLVYEPAVPNVKDGPSLLTYLRQAQISHGVAVKDLKDGWPDCDKTLTELDDKHEILISRKKNNDLPLRVWINDFPIHHAIPEGFRARWLSIELPSIEEMERQLEEAGLNPIGQRAQGPTVTAPCSGSRKPKRRRKQMRQRQKSRMTTNVHMQHLLRDYSHD